MAMDSVKTITKRIGIVFFGTVWLLSHWAAGSVALADGGVGAPDAVSVQRQGSNHILVDTDFMKGLPLRHKAGQIIVGNPVIADIVVRDDQYIFISGKSAGRTNMLVYGKDGLLKESYVISVRNAANYLTVMKGAANRSHYDCLPNCERVFRIEDSVDNAGEQSGKISTGMGLIDGRAERASARDSANAQQGNLASGGQ